MANQIKLIVEPRKVYTWRDFKKHAPQFSIALDGIVEDVTMREPNGPYANFDHHKKVDRIGTRSTSEQVHMEINLGLFDTFRDDGIPKANVFVNDPDEDTCLAVWLLRNHERVVGHAEPLINRLVYCEDRLDCTAGAYPFGDTEMRRKMAWIFHPYNSARFEGKIATMDAAGMESVIDSVGARITDHTLGKGDELLLEGNYEKIGGGSGWSLVKETGPASRLAMYNDGLSAYVALVAEKQDGSYVYTIGRKSVWTPFCNEKIYAHLNNVEADIVKEGNNWGGSDTIGGSPRQTGSKLAPHEVEEQVKIAINSAE